MFMKDHSKIFTEVQLSRELVFAKKHCIDRGLVFTKSCFIEHLEQTIEDELLREELDLASRVYDRYVFGPTS